MGCDKSGLIGEDPDGIPNNLMPYVSQVYNLKKNLVKKYLQLFTSYTYN